MPHGTELGDHGSTLNPELELPELQDAVLSPTVLGELLGDIEQAAELLELRVKTRAHGHSLGASPKLSDVIPLLAAGHAVQLRYRHAGKQWLDTLLPHPNGFRLVRIEAIMPPGGSAQPA